MQKIMKLRAGKYRMPVTLTYKENNRIFLKFGFNKKLQAEIKQMQGARWHGFEEPPIKAWSIENCARNDFQLAYLAGENPYAIYESELVPCKTDRNLMSQQLLMVSHILTRRQCVIAGEMGTGKSLAFIEAMEQADLKDHEAWYIGPKSGVKAVNLELSKWQSKVTPKMMTYENMVRDLKHWDGKDAPRMVFFDESSKIKTPTSQRSQAALHVANSIRAEYGNKGFVVLASGTPAPKSPVDWWHQSEVACPGFLAEGHIGKFRARLAITQERESITGGVYPHHLGWKDVEGRCAVCGAQEDGGPHDEMQALVLDLDFHKYEPCINEIEHLFKRMQGLVIVIFKKDCMDLPDKRYEVISIKPSVETLRAMKVLRKTAPRVITFMSKCRELSDGFQYTEVQDGLKKCEGCKGTATVNVPEPDTECPRCKGSGEERNMVRVAKNLGSPKDQIFIDDLDAHEDIGRLIVWGGFTATIDRLIDITHKQGWSTLRVDGRGYHGSDPMGEIIDSDELLIAMDRSHPRYLELQETYAKICFIGHPRAGGMALTLTAAPTEIFYSNDFSGEARSQAEDRFHRAGMDSNRGGLIKDYIHLPTDLVVLNNLKAKRSLEKMTLGDLDAALKEAVC